MANSGKQTKLIHRVNRGIASSKPGAWFFSRMLHHMDRPVFRLSKGKYSATSLLAGLPLVMLTTIGAKSGKERTVPLLAIPDGENLILIATNWGQTYYPSWYYNLSANPEATIMLQGESPRSYIAHEATGEERERLWQAAVNTYAGYVGYEQRIAASSKRSIPVMLMTPIADETVKAKAQD
jgi:deazaflavin-dependent oxidoreductase (nitroreductase family)